MVNPFAQKIQYTPRRAILACKVFHLLGKIQAKASIRIQIRGSGSDPEFPNRPQNLFGDDALQTDHAAPSIQ
jgi:hypothetical protein